MKGVINTAKENPILFQNMSVGMVSVSFPSKVLPFLKCLQLIGHNMLHAPKLCTGIIVTVTFQEVDRSPDTKTCANSYYESLKYAYCVVEKYNNS